MYSKFEILLQQRNIKAYAVSKATGIPTSTLSEWKKGKYTPKPDKLIKIANYFNVPIDYFYENDIPQEITSETKKVPKDLQKILENEELTLNGRILSSDDKKRLFDLITVAFELAKNMNKRK